MVTPKPKIPPKREPHPWSRLQRVSAAPKSPNSIPKSLAAPGFFHWVRARPLEQPRLPQVLSQVQTLILLQEIPNLPPLDPEGEGKGKSG